MKVGRLRHRITIEEFVTSQDSDGAAEESWLSIGPPISAEIMPMSGRELIAAAAVQSKVTTRIKMRYRPGIKAAQRALHRETVFNIEAVIPDPDSGVGYMTLLCTSGVNNG
jgi:SPP1 family predicted phage head-tail adaptor